MKPIIIIGGGKSVSEGISLGLWDNIKGQDIMTCNNAILHIPYAPKYAVWLDSTDKDPEVIGKIMETDCIRVTQMKHDQQDDTRVTRFEICRFPKNLQEGLKQGVLYAGGRMFTGIFGISLSLYLGYQQIFLLGFDWGGCVKNKGDEVEWWGTTNYFKGTDMNIYRDGAGARNDCAAHHDPFIGKADIINVSPYSLIPSFPKVGYGEFFNLITKGEKC